MSSPPPPSSPGLPRTEELPPDRKHTPSAETWDEGEHPTHSGVFVVVGTETPGRYDRGDEELGRGGIGRVLVAFDAHLGREIAVKELLAGGTAVGRFLREARVTAQLEHPNIVPVYELGRRADGTLYYTMKRVRGRTLADALDACEGMDDRLRLLSHFVDLCQAIAYAHSRGVVHRDIKPANVMVGEFGETVVLDWGLAKARGQRDLRGGDLARDLAMMREADTSSTLQGTMLGTPAYMSPEQATGDIDHIDERSDVWALGAVLFEILTGVPPFSGHTPMEILAKVVHEPPPQADEAPVELAKVASKALRREPAERYQSAKELADEIAAWQAGGTVRAHQYTSWELARKFVARNRAAVTLMSVAVALLCVFYGAETARMVGARDQAIAAQRDTAARLAEALAGRAEEALGHGDAAGAWVLAANALAQHETPEARGAAIAAASGWLPRAAWRADVGEPCAQLAWAPDGHALAAIGRRGAWVREGADGHMSLLDMQGEAAGSIAWGKARLYTAHAAGSVLGWDPPKGVVERIGSADDGVRAFAVLGDGRVVTGGWGGPVRVWDGKRPRTIGAHAGAVDAVAAAGSIVATAGADGTRVWDVARGRAGVVAEPARAVALSPDGRWLAAGAWLWDLGAGAGVGRLGEGEARTVAFSPDGARLLVGAGDAVDLWDVATRTRIGRRRASDEVTAVGWSPDGARIAVATADGVLRAWDVPAPAAAFGEAAPAESLDALAARRDEFSAIVAHGDLVATGDRRGGVTLWRAGRPAATWTAHASRVEDLAFSRDGNALRSQAADGTRVWALATLATPAPALVAEGEQRLGLRLEGGEVVEVP